MTTDSITLSHKLCTYQLEQPPTPLTIHIIPLSDPHVALILSTPPTAQFLSIRLQTADQGIEHSSQRPPSPISCPNHFRKVRSD